MIEQEYQILNRARPNEKDLHLTENKYGRSIKIRCKFPKSIKKNTYILSEFGPVTFDAMREFMALCALKKPLGVCATSGRWEGMPFLLIAEDDFEITEEDEKFIDNYKSHLKLEYKE